MLFWRAISRPLRLLTFSPIVFILSMYASTVYGYLYMLFTTIPAVYEEIYGFSQGTVGLAYLGIGIGMIISLVAFGTRQMLS
jgi:predicted MFS family arabinose efflux permease